MLKLDAKTLTSIECDDIMVRRTQWSGHNGSSDTMGRTDGRKLSFHRLTLLRSSPKIGVVTSFGREKYSTTVLILGDVFIFYINFIVHEK